MAARASTFSMFPPSCTILRLRSLTASSLEARSDGGRGSPLKRRTYRFACFGLAGDFLPGGEGVVCLGGGESWVPEAVAFA